LLRVVINLSVCKKADGGEALHIDKPAVGDLHFGMRGRAMKDSVMSGVLFASPSAAKTSSKERSRFTTKSALWSLMSPATAKQVPHDLVAHGIDEPTFHLVEDDGPP
jgi:hypothetical protein